MNEILTVLVYEPFLHFKGFGSYVACLEVGIFLICTAKLTFWFGRVIPELRLVNRQLKNEKRNSGSLKANFEKLKTIFMRTVHVKHAWEEFEEGIIDEGDPSQGMSHFRSTYSAATYFNFSDLIEKDSGVPFYKEVPQILTGLGIIGTFLGLVTSLPNELGQGDLSNHIVGVLVGMKGAYVSSVWGVLLAVIFSAIKKASFGYVHGEISDIAINLDRIFKRVTTEEYLWKTVVNTKAQLDELKSLANDLPRKLVENMTGAGVANNIDEAVKVNLSEGFKSVNDNILQFQSFHRELVATATQIQQTFVRLGLGLGNATSAVQSYASLLEASGKTLQQGVSEIDRASSSWSGAARDVIQIMEKQQNAGEAMREAVTLTNQNLDKFTEAQNTLSSTATTSVREFIDQYRGFQEAILNYNKQINSSLNSSLGLFDSELGKGVSSLGTSIQDLSDFLANMHGSLAEVKKTLENMQPKEEAA